MNETLPEKLKEIVGGSVSAQTIRNLRMICEAVWPGAPENAGVADFVNQAKNSALTAGLSSRQHEELIHAVLGGSALNHALAVEEAKTHRSLSVAFEEYQLRLAGVLTIAESRTVPVDFETWHETLRNCPTIAAVIRLLRDFLKADGYASARGTELTDVRSEVDALENDLAETKELLSEAERERDEKKLDYDRACKTIAAMHASAVGEVTGPARGVVEDVADLRSRCLAAEEALSNARKDVAVPTPTPAKKGGGK